MVLTTWYNSIYCVPFTGFALFVSFFMCTYFLSHNSPLQISSSFNEGVVIYMRSFPHPRLGPLTPQLGAVSEGFVVYSLLEELCHLGWT